MHFARAIYAHSSLLFQSVFREMKNLRVHKTTHLDDLSTSVGFACIRKLFVWTEASLSPGHQGNFALNQFFDFAYHNNYCWHSYDFLKKQLRSSFRRISCNRNRCCKKPNIKGKKLNCQRFKKCVVFYFFCCASFASFYSTGMLWAVMCRRQVNVKQEIFIFMFFVHFTSKKREMNLFGLVHSSLRSYFD